MNIVGDKRKQRLLEALKNKEYRDEYISAGVDVGIAFQIRALRKQQKPKPWTQTELANRAKMKQPRIHELEDPSKSPTLSTLKALANAFEVGLLVKFVPISELVKHELNLSSDSLDVLSFEQDPYFQAKKEETVITADHEQYTEIPTQEASSKVVSIEDYLVRRTNFYPSRKILTAIASSEHFLINH